MGQPYLVPHSFFLRTMPRCSVQEAQAAPKLGLRQRRQAAAAGGAPAGPPAMTSTRDEMWGVNQGLGCAHWKRKGDAAVEKCSCFGPDAGRGSSTEVDGSGERQECAIAPLQQVFDRVDKCGLAWACLGLQGVHRAPIERLNN